MESKVLIPILVSCLLILSSFAGADVDVDGSLSLHVRNNGTLEWLHLEAAAEHVEDEEEELEGEDEEELGQRRSLLYWGHQWPRRRYYISYGALSANRIPCPPRSGRSYYTHNCYSARGPVHPYTRGCSAITRCRR